MIGNLKGEHDSIIEIKMVSHYKTFDMLKVVFNRDVVYYIDVETNIIWDMEGTSDIIKEDLELMRSAISRKIEG